MSKIKVAHIGNAVGGVDVSIRLSLRNLDSTLFSTFIIKQKSKSKSEFYFNEIGEQIPEYNISLQREISPFKDLKAIIELIKILKAKKPDLIHSHSAKAGILGRIAGFFLSIPVAYTPHAFSFLSSQNELKRRIYILIERFVTTRKSFLIACSNSEKELAIEKKIFTNDKAYVVNNGISSIDKPSINTNNYNLPKKYICTVGRPSYQKNIEKLVEILFQIKKTKDDIHLVILGVGEYSPNANNVERKIKSLGLEKNITLVKWIPREEIFPIIFNSQLYVSTARYEGLPYSIIEAMALGKSSVVSNCPGNRDLIINDFNGYVIKSDEVADYVQKINKILNSNEQREIFEKNAFQLFGSNFKIEITIKKLENVYTKIFSLYKKN